MSDNRTTELLREIQSLLDKRGAEYTVQDALPGWLFTVEHPTETWTYKICVHTTGLIDIWGSHITPEQAVAATLGEQIIRCRDCKHATISTTGVCKYCEMFVLPDVDGYGADSQVNLPLDFFCGFAERKEVD